MTKRLGNILLVCFGLSFVFLLISHIIFYGFNPQVVGLIEDVCKLSPHDINYIFFCFYAVVKIIIVFGFLVPAIAIKLTERD